MLIAPGSRQRLWWARLIWALAAAAFVGLWLWGIATTPLSVRETARIQMVPVGEIRQEQTVGQTFLAPYDGLYRIEVFLADYGRLNSRSVEFRLSSSPEVRPPVRTARLAAHVIRGDVMHTVEFDPIPDSAGQQYYFELSAPDAVPGNAITAYLRPSAPYPNGTAYWAGRPAQGDLVFAAYFSVSPWERARILLAQMTANKPLLWGDWRFYIGIAATYLVLLAVLIRQMMEVQSADETEKP